MGLSLLTRFVIFSKKQNLFNNFSVIILSVKLNILWLKNSIGITLEQEIQTNKRIALLPYYFWPRTDAWEQIKLELEARAWISVTERTNTLNNIANIINCWQNKTGNETLDELQQKFEQVHIYKY